jgi:hypothetical protein
MNTTAANLVILLERLDTTTFEGIDADTARHIHDRTLASFGPFRFGSQEARLKAAEICKDVMRAK